MVQRWSKAPYNSNSQPTTGIGTSLQHAGDGMGRPASSTSTWTCAEMWRLASQWYVAYSIAYTYQFALKPKHAFLRILQAICYVFLMLASNLPRCLLSLSSPFRQLLKAFFFAHIFIHKYAQAKLDFVKNLHNTVLNSASDGALRPSWETSDKNSFARRLMLKRPINHYFWKIRKHPTTRRTRFNYMNGFM